MREEVFPDYGEGSLLEVPGTVLSLFGLDTELSTVSGNPFEDVDTDVRNVVLLVIDGFGMEQWKNFPGGVFEKIEEEGNVSEITSTFPSATPATLTTLNTGLEPVQHTLLGWEMYYEEVGSKILTLPFRTTDWEEIPGEPDPGILFEGEPVYGKLENQGVETYSLLDEEIADTEYTELVHDGSERVPCINVADMFLRMRRLLEEEGRKYIYSYVSEIDTVDHRRGPKTEDEHNQLEMISESLERNLVDEMGAGAADETLLLITADHGQIEAEEEIDLMQYEKVRESLEEDSSGKTITPCGGGRSVFLHVKEGQIEELKSFLENEIEGKVMESREAVERGLFGEAEVGEKFYKRAGDLVLIPGGKKIAWFETSEIEQVGYHGGLHPQEMVVPFAAVKLSDLR